MANVIASDKRQASTLHYRGHTYTPKNGSLKFTVGPSAWLKDEGELTVDEIDAHTIRVSAFDAQILFPPAEIWVRSKDRFERLLKDDLIDG